MTHDQNTNSWASLCKEFSYSCKEFSYSPQWWKILIISLTWNQLIGNIFSLWNSVVEEPAAQEEKLLVLLRLSADRHFENYLFPNSVPPVNTGEPGLGCIKWKAQVKLHSNYRQSNQVELLLKNKNANILIRSVREDCSFVPGRLDQI